MPEPLDTAAAAAETKGARTRARIVAAGRVVFGRDGYTAARMSDIAEHAELSQGAVYRYFRNKDDVFRAVVGQLDQHMYEATRTGQPFQDDPADALYAANLRFFRAYWEYRDVYRAFREIASRDIAYQSIWEDIRRRFRGRFLHVLTQATGRPTDRSTELRTLAMQCCVEEFAYTNFAERRGPGVVPPIGVEEAARIVSDIWVAAFADVLGDGSPHESAQA